MSKLGSMSDKVMGDCERCGRPVRENHSHIMIVPVGHKRMYYHAGCEPIRDKPDLAKDKIGTEDAIYLGDDLG